MQSWTGNDKKSMPDTENTGTTPVLAAGSALDADPLQLNAAREAREARELAYIEPPSPLVKPISSAYVTPSETSPPCSPALSPLEPDTGQSTGSKGGRRVKSRTEITEMGRLHLQSEDRTNQSEADPFMPFFHAVEFCQTCAVPLLTGRSAPLWVGGCPLNTGHQQCEGSLSLSACVCVCVRVCRAPSGMVAALIMANVDPDTYEYYFTGDACPTGYNMTAPAAAGGTHRRLLAGDACQLERWRLLDCPLFGHQVTLHFLANDIIMAFFFGLAMKEVPLERGQHWHGTVTPTPTPGDRGPLARGISQPSLQGSQPDHHHTGGRYWARRGLFPPARGLCQHR